MKAHVRKTGQLYPQQPNAGNSASAIDGRVQGLRCLHMMGSAGHRKAGTDTRRGWALGQLRRGNVAPAPQSLFSMTPFIGSPRKNSL